MGRFVPDLFRGLLTGTVSPKSGNNIFLKQYLHMQDTGKFLKQDSCFNNDTKEEEEEEKITLPPRIFRIHISKLPLYSSIYET